MGTRKISQLETISDANLSGEAILPVVVSDPLIPNRKVKVNQLFKGVAQGSKASPGLTFDLDRDSGLYQNAYGEFGISFGDSGLYMTRIENSSTSVSLYVTAVDDNIVNADLVLAPKGTGAVKIAGQFLMTDESFILQDAQGPKARFEIGTVGSGTNTRVMTLPTILQGNGTVLVGDDTTQTLRNKTILIDEDNFVLVDGEEEAVFQINWDTSTGIRRQYFLPDPGPVSTTAEPTATSSTLLDTKTEQTILSKTLVDPKIVSNAEIGTPTAILNTTNLTADRTITFPDLSLTLVGVDTTQTLTNKTIESLILQDPDDATKKITFKVNNANTLSNRSFGFPQTALLNSDAQTTNTIVTETATQELTNKSLVAPKIKPSAFSSNQVILDTSNITGSRTIKFPDSDATLLSTDNVQLEDVSFGAGIAAENLVGRTRLQQFFYAGF